MRSNLYSNSSPTSGGPASEGNRNAAGYAASAVPLHVYRQVTYDLEQTRKQVEAVETENQRLREENETFRTEIMQLIKVSRRLQGMVEHYDHPAYALPDAVPQTPLWTETENYAREQGSDRSFVPNETPQPRDYSQPYSPEGGAANPSRELTGWWLFLTVALIVATAFGTGFLIVRPFLTPEQPEIGTPREVPSP